MTKILILYTTRGGHTKVIIDHLVKALPQGIQCDIRNLLEHPKVSLEGYQAVLIGGPIYYGYFHRVLRSFVHTHQVQLNSMPSAFFGINLIARNPEKRTIANNSYVRKFLEKTLWQPRLVGIFAGALYYPRYNFFDRFMIQLIMKMTGGETDPTKEIVYTDWHDVTAFAQKIPEMIKGEQTV